MSSWLSRPPGPKGLGYMPVVAGVAIPKGTPDRATAARLIEYLTRPEVQVDHAARDRLLPGGQGGAAGRPGAGAAAGERRYPASGRGAERDPLAAAGRARREERRVQQGVHRHLPADRRAQPGHQGSLETQGEKLAGIMQAAGAPCWQPDAPSDGPCPVE